MRKRVFSSSPTGVEQRVAHPRHQREERCERDDLVKARDGSHHEVPRGAMPLLRRGPSCADPRAQHLTRFARAHASKPSMCACGRRESRDARPSEGRLLSAPNTPTPDSVCREAALSVDHSGSCCPQCLGINGGIPLMARSGCFLLRRSAYCRAHAPGHQHHRPLHGICTWNCMPGM